MEKILAEDVPEGLPMRISSVVQNRGSIPLFWSQETSLLNLKPDIILSKRDHTYVTTRLHFENLVKRFGNPIIILNLVKTLVPVNLALLIYISPVRLLLANILKFVGYCLKASGNSYFDIFDFGQ
ncbi:UNVERIFIED_CONTAM: Phosphoinositide phosphatase SAC3 [Sesamum calycinum]|uniref:Phosphoinositide phosphatase SAC3 n=1 Tax=Sesamum calycinum TaxID=2727403 RepID=A0AAW2P5B3_9LAMI